MRIAIVSFLCLIITCFFWSCQKELSLEGSNIKLAAGTWQFNDSTKLFRGNIDTAYVESSGSTKILNLLGTSLTGTEFFEIQLKSLDSFRLGTYTASLDESEFKYFTSAKTIYQADQFTGEMLVTITALGNKKITGTFAGIARDSSGVLKVITLGKFTSTIILIPSTGTGSATGTLGTIAGACNLAIPTGTYTQGVALTAANTVPIQVNVVTPGTYTISTNTVNGVSFSKTGTFTTTGLQNVILSGSGTPVNSGLQNYTVSFGTSNCLFLVLYTAGSGAATGTLGGTPGACTPVTPAGVYTQGVALTAANTVTIQVTVNTLGTYSISTNTVNGVVFSKSGTFTVTGPQNLILAGSGTPTNSGVQNYTVSFSGNMCTFPLTFNPASAANTDYFPLTANSFWTYDNSNSFPDSSYKVSGSMGSLAGNTYRFVYYGSGAIGSNTTDSTPYRKLVNDYFEYVSVDTFSTVTFDVPQHAELLFLKENSTTGATWTTQEFIGTQSSIAVKLKYTFTITNTNTTLTVNGVPFSNVIQVSWKSLVDNGAGYADDVLWQTYYAKGVGLIKNTATDPTMVTTYFSEALRNYHVY